LFLYLCKNGKQRLYRVHSSYDDLPSVPLRERRGGLQRDGIGGYPIASRSGRDYADYGRKKKYGSQKVECPAPAPAPPPIPCDCTCPTDVVPETVETTTACVPAESEYGPIGFAIDNTGSNSGSSTSISRFVNDIVDALISEDFKIPQYVATTFNDDAQVTKTIQNSASVDDLKRSINEIRYSGGGDLPERATEGILKTLQQLEVDGVLLAFTDAPTKDPNLESKILAEKRNKNAKIFIILTPQYLGSEGDESWNLYKRISDNNVFNMADISKEKVIESLIKEVADNCLGNSGAEVGPVGDGLPELPPKEEEAKLECPTNWIIDSVTHCKVPIKKGLMANSDNVKKTCGEAGMKPVCNGPADCQYNGPAGFCVLTAASKTCGNGNIADMAQLVCNKGITQCPEMDKVFGASFDWQVPCGLRNGVYCLNWKQTLAKEQEPEFTSGSPDTLFAFCAQ